MKHSLWLPFKPHAKQRPRLGRGRRVFTPEATMDAEAAIRDWYDGPTFDGELSLWIDFYPDAMEVTLEEVEWTSPLRGDVDNYVKTVMDALQPVAFTNDKQVMDLWARKHPHR